MTVRTAPWPDGVPCWADLQLADPDAALGFYRAVLGWEVAGGGPDTGGFYVGGRRGARAAAVGPGGGAGPAAWRLYLASADVEATARAVAAAGGTLLVPPGDVGDAGRAMHAADPSGAAFGVWQGGTHIGAGLVNEPGGLCWEDLRSTDPAAARDFYAAVFGYRTEALEAAGPDYWLFFRPGEDAPLGGMGGLMGEPGPSRWLVYFGVEDAGAAVEAAAAHGGRVARPPFATPYGTMAAVADPEGAVCMVVETTGADQPDRSG